MRRCLWQRQRGVAWGTDVRHQILVTVHIYQQPSGGARHPCAISSSNAALQRAATSMGCMLKRLSNASPRNEKKPLFA